MKAVGGSRDALVVFSPSGKRGHFAPGTRVLDAAHGLGVDIDSICGGHAMCGRCQVEVTEGELAKLDIASSAANLSPPGEAEKQFLGDDCGRRRLGCRARIRGDVAIDVPPGSQVHKQVVRKPYEAHDIEINPVVELCFVELDPPRLGEVGGDLQRLVSALQRHWRYGELGCSLSALRQLQHVVREGDWQLTAAVRYGHEIVAVWPGLKQRVFGAAIDVGSTTLAVHLCDLRSGDVVACSGSMNPQIRFGEDLMSRVSYIMSNPGEDRELTRIVRLAINELITEVVVETGVEIDDIVELTIVGNPIMQHLVLGISPVELGHAPFTLANDESVDVLASELGLRINLGGHVYVLPCIAGHVGADTAGVMLAEAPFDRDDVSLIVDVGTNAELLLGNRQRLLAASSPTGPAFEGAQISSGQRATPGAIERVRIDRETLEPRFKVIGSELWSDAPGFAGSLPDGGITGICGSGIIEAIAELFLSGVVNADGRINSDGADRTQRIEKDGHGWSYVLYDGKPKVGICQHDVRAIQLAKASMYAGARLLMHRFGVDRVDRIRLAGAFGAHIDVTYAMVLGLIPDCSLDAVSSAGNAAGTGARIALLDGKSRALIEEQVRKVEKIETGAESDFQDYFVAAMTLPHESDSFPELGKAIELPQRTARPRRSVRRAPAHDGEAR